MIDISTQTTAIRQEPRGEDVRDAIISAVKTINDDYKNVDILKGTTESPEDVTSEDLIYDIDSIENIVTERLNPDEEPSEDSQNAMSSGYFFHKIGLDIGNLTDYVLSIISPYIYEEPIEYTGPNPVEGSLAELFANLFEAYEKIAEKITTQDTAQPVVVQFGVTPLSAYPAAIDMLFHYKIEDCFPISENGTYKVEDYQSGADRPVWKSIDIHVPRFSPSELTITENGTYETAHRTPYTKVKVNVPFDPLEHEYKDNTLKSSAYFRFTGSKEYIICNSESDFDPPQSANVNAVYVLSASDDRPKAKYYVFDTETSEYKEIGE